MSLFSFGADNRDCERFSLWAFVVPAIGIGGYMDLLREYQKEHPEECVELNRIKAHSQMIAESRKALAQEKLKRIEECRRILYGKE